MNALRMCLNWKVLTGLATVGVGVYVLAPELMAEALPVLLLAACPLSMLFMMWSMQHAQGQGQQTPQDTDAGLTREERSALLREQQAALDDRGAGAGGGPPGFLWVPECS
jgi:hypothetical protein